MTPHDASNNDAGDSSEMNKTPDRPVSRLRRWCKRIMIGAGFAVVMGVLLFAILWFAFPFPAHRLNQWPVSPLVTDREGQTLLRLVAADDQLYVPVRIDDVSDWLVQATVAVEDERFYSHPGVDVVALGRAVLQNVIARDVVSGASTLTMQICKLMDNRPRRLTAKAIEAFRALQLESIRDKKAIMELYLNVAPYGGNRRGAYVASYDFFRKHPRDLSLGEAAMLAGLPQSPSRYLPTKWAGRAEFRKQKVLHRMREAGFISEAQLAVALADRIQIHTPLASDRLAPHAATIALQQRPAGGRASIDVSLQRQVNERARDHLATMPVNSNVGVVVIDIASSQVLAMVGSANPTDPADGQVNTTTAKRSPGSALKPFVYAAAFDARRLAPDSTVYDIPIERAGWSPRNFDRSFRGEVTATEALRASLNIPAIVLAEQIGVNRCVGLMDSLGIQLPPIANERGGLTLAVGGIEVSLLHLTNAYAAIGRGGVYRRASMFVDEVMPERSVLSKATCNAINQILSSHDRSVAGLEKVATTDRPWFAWKTGTSSGRRDAWAVGHNLRYAIGVWVGRTSGAGNARYVGAQAAEPLLAKLFSLTSIRSDTPPDDSATWQVVRPLPRPRELDDSLLITSPRNGVVYRAVSGDVRLTPTTNVSRPLHWFLNGRATNWQDQLVLAAGDYELRCTDADGRSDSVRFRVE